MAKHVGRCASIIPIIISGIRNNGQTDAKGEIGTECTVQLTDPPLRGAVRKGTFILEASKVEAKSPAWLDKRSVSSG